MKTKSHITKTSIITTIDFMMAQTGINREQATIAFHTIVHLFPKHPAEPFNKLRNLFRANRNRDNCSMN
jgi:hypothetical protein